MFRIVIGLLVLLVPLITYQNCGQAEMATTPQFSVTTSPTPDRFPTTFDGQPAVVVSKGVRCPWDTTKPACQVTLGGVILDGYNQPITNQIFTMCARYPFEPTFVSGGCVLLITDGNGVLLGGDPQNTALYLKPWVGDLCFVHQVTNWTIGVWQGDQRQNVSILAPWKQFTLPLPAGCQGV